MIGGIKSPQHRSMEQFRYFWGQNVSPDFKSRKILGKSAANYILRGLFPPIIASMKGPGVRHAYPGFLKGVGG